MATFSIDKDPNALLDYMLDWEDWLDGDTITTASWSVPDGITQEDTARTTTTATIWLSGGTLNQSYPVTCHITTAGGREDDRTILFRIKDK